MKRALLILAALAVIGAGAGLVVLYSGFYNVAATQQHTAPVFRVIETAMKQSIDRHADDVVPPDRLTDDMAERGLRHYREHCVQCHGAPGVAPDDFALGMRPVPSNLVQSARRLSASEVFWVVKHGIKMTGMPAWDYRMPDSEVWDIAAFVSRLPEIAPAAYEDMVQALEERETARSRDTRDHDGDPDRGRKAILQYGCISCHIVPGVVGREVRVGPSLEGMGSRKYIAGVLANTPQNMILWLKDPPAVDPLTAMPDLGVTPAHARDIAAYLDSLESD